MRQLGVFAKYWQPGQAKTRLAVEIGADAAARLAKEMLAVTLQRFADCADRRVLAFSPPEHRTEFALLAGPSWVLEPQSAGDLGTRMQTHFERAFATGAEQVVLIGSDSPLLSTTYLQQAFDLLERAPVVLGPSADGGYYLVGSRQMVPIFDDMPWSTEQLWAQTIARLNARSIDYARLPGWYDIDQIADLHRLRTDLAREQADDLDGLRQAVESALSGLYS